ncbi:MAG: hypothetical protein LRY73_17695 [Bacillus sp. (in: Bacteria)]|nr:hypothetical protein [Bacillus sp. (in: firmicutes)]
MIAFLYGNRTTALLLTAGMVFYRFTLSGDGFYIFITAYGITIALLFLYYKQYLWFSFRKKLIATVGITILYASIVVSLIHFFLPEPFQFEPFFFTFVVMHPLMTGLCIYVIEMYRENERLRMEIQRGERMDTVSQMAASVAHEIRNPMTVVRGFTQLLQRDSRVQEHHHAKLELMLHELDRAENIIKDYLTLAKPALMVG